MLPLICFRPLMLKQPKTDQVVVGLTNDMLFAQHPLLTETKHVVKTDRHIVEIQCLTADLVEPDILESEIQGSQSELLPSALRSIRRNIEAPFCNAPRAYLGELNKTCGNIVVLENEKASGGVL